MYRTEGDEYRYWWMSQKVDDDRIMYVNYTETDEFPPASGLYQCVHISNTVKSYVAVEFS
jgi:hypothetical protein